MSKRQTQPPSVEDRFPDRLLHVFYTGDHPASDVASVSGTPFLLTGLSLSQPRLHPDVAGSLALMNPQNGQPS